MILVLHNAFDFLFRCDFHNWCNLTVIDGWDISNDNIGDAMRKAQVLEVGLQDQVYDKLSKLKPRPSIYDPDFIAANQVCRALKAQPTI